jgi:hypothetical protein
MASASAAEAATSRPKSRRVNWVLAGSAEVDSIVMGPWRPGWDGSVLRVVARQVGAGEGLGDEPGENLAIGATAGPR